MLLFRNVILICVLIDFVAAICDYDNCVDCLDARCSWCASKNECRTLLTIVMNCPRTEIIWFNSYKCPAEPALPYSDTFGRMKALPAIAAASTNHPQDCLKNALQGAQLKRQLTMPCDVFKKKDTCSGYTAVSHADRAIIASFRGTKGLNQLLTEIAEAAAYQQVDFHGGGKIEAYFYKAFDTLWQAGMKDDLTALIKDPKNSGYDLWVVGHSLGGAMASVCAAVVVDSKMFPSKKLKMVTIGQPRTGNMQFAQAHDRLVPNSYRIVHARDIVPHVPPQSMAVYHHRFEIWYNNGMFVGDDYVVCDRPDDNSCSSSILHLSGHDHLHYYGVDVTKFGKAGCIHSNATDDGATGYGSEPDNYDEYLG